MSYQDVQEKKNEDINYDEIASSMLEKMDKHINGEKQPTIHYENLNVQEQEGAHAYYSNQDINNINSGMSFLKNVKELNSSNILDHRTTTNDVGYPRRVMTALGPLPLPEEFKKNIPEKFVAKPIIEEREIYVSKKERKQREIEIPHVKYEHTFENVKKQLKVNKLVPNVTQVIKEVPKEILKPVIEEKIIEVPQGVKYVEVPVEVPCLYPPKIMPKVVTQYVERIVETIKPVVQEKIIEVPQTVIKQVPKIKTVEVPYYVPRYVEKIIEVPFKPNGEMPKIATHLPISISDSLPPLKPTHILSAQNEKNITKHNNNMNSNNMNNMNPLQTTNFMMPLMNCFQQNPDPNTLKNSENGIPNMNMSPTILRPINSRDTPNNNMNPQEHIKNNITPYPNNSLNSNFTNYNMPQNLYSQIENLPHAHNLPDGFQWQYPDGVSNNPLCNTRNMPSLVVTCPPQIGRVTCTRKDIQPDILTKTGVYEFDGFKKKGTSQSLFPPLAHHNRVPFLPAPAAPGTPDVENIEKNM
ncbi:inner membrane complex protein 1h, putative [Plasmodium sp. gorilla clade G1]|nr:inner membrane complex protein 1h, putative [Plasmodium sp. gorilla clade G1]